MRENAQGEGFPSMRHKQWQVVTLVVPAVLFLVAARDATFHVDSAFAGTSARFASAVQAVGGPGDARRALWLDLAFVLGWVVVVPRLLSMGWRQWSPPWRRATAWWGAAPVVAIAAAGFDAVENLLCLAIAGDGSPPTSVTLTIATAAWARSVGYVAALLAVVMLVIGPVTAPLRQVVGAWASSLPDRLAGRRLHPGQEHDQASASDGARPVGEGIGICLSGGGIRAASVGLGALQALDEPAATSGPSVFRRTRWMSAVSGGAYTACGWRASRHPGSSITPPPDAERDGLFGADGAWMRSVAARHQFLDNGTLSLAGGIVGALVRVAAVLGAVLSTAVIGGWAVGRVIRSAAVLRRFPLGDDGTPLHLGDLFQARLAVPWVVPLVVALGACVVMLSLRSGRGPWRAVAVAAAGYATAIAVFTSLAPAGIYLMPGVFREISGGGDNPNQGAGIVALLTSLGVVSAIVGALRTRLKRAWMFLGGWLLLAGWLVLGGKIADTYARGMSGAARAWHLGGLTLAVPLVAVLWLLAVDLVPSHRLTLGGIYRKRLAATFALAAPTGGASPVPLPPLRYGDEPAWPAYIGADGPELIVAATAHASGRRFTSLPAFGFTFTPSAVTLYDTPDGRGVAVPSADYPMGSWWRGYPRGWVVTRSMALTGAAFASAMGRQALGSTNALLAAVNVRLGAWVPNPRHADWFVDGAQPRVHLGYLAKEILGRYHPDRDPFVYVADGGHRENLGLVEMLRMRPSSVLVVDASGDSPGAFTTLGEAMQLAVLELDVRIEIDLDPLRSIAPALPTDCTAEGVIRYPDSMGGGTGRLLYGRNQLSQLAPLALLQFAAADPIYPNYSTGDQYLTDAQFATLVGLGHHVGTRLAERLAAAPPA
jgi:hypothetical protein